MSQPNEPAPDASDDEHPTTAGEVGHGEGARLPAQGGGEGVTERDGDVAGIVGRMDGGNLGPEDAGGVGRAGGGGE